MKDEGAKKQPIKYLKKLKKVIKVDKDISGQILAEVNDVFHPQKRGPMVEISGKRFKRWIILPALEMQDA